MYACVAQAVSCIGLFQPPGRLTTANKATHNPRQGSNHSDSNRHQPKHLGDCNHNQTAPHTTASQPHKQPHTARNSKPPPEHCVEISEPAQPAHRAQTAIAQHGCELNALPNWQAWGTHKPRKQQQERLGGAVHTFAMYATATWAL